VDVFVEQAKGLIVGRQGCSFGEAAQLLHWLTTEAGGSPTEVAQLLVNPETRTLLLRLLPDAAAGF
jgi:hypothetical protein